MEIKTLPDEDLAIYVREVDQEAYKELVLRYEVSLVRYAKLLLGNELKAHEVVQEAFIECFRNIHAFNPRMKFSVFLYRYAHQAIKGALHKKHQEIGNYEDILEELSGEDEIEHEFVDRELLPHIKMYLYKLSPQYKESLVLHFISQKSYDEIAEILQIPLASVTARVGIAKNLIKRYAKN